MPASWPAPVARIGACGAVGASASGARIVAGSKVVSSVQDSSRGTVRIAGAADWFRGRRRARPPPTGPRASSHAVTRDGIALTPLGSTRTLPNVASAPCRRAPRARGEARRRRRPASGRGGRPAGSCRRGWPRRRSRTASARAARSSWPLRPVRRGRPGRGPARRAARRTSRSVAAQRDPGRPASGRRPRRSHASRHRPAVAVAQRAGPVGVQCAGEQARARAGDAVARALLVGEVDHRDRPVGLEALGPQHLDRSQRRDDPTARRTRRRRAPSRGGCR